MATPACPDHGGTATHAMRYDLRWAFWYCPVNGCETRFPPPSSATAATEAALRQDEDDKPEAT